METIRIVCISDTHNHSPGQGYTLPTGDILIHAGDLTNQGSLPELQKAVSWLSKLDFPVKVIVAGNHDLSLDPSYTLRHETGWKVLPENVEACRNLVINNPDFVYLQHEAAEIHLPEKDVRLRVFGSPYSPDRGRQNWAFQYPPETSVWGDVPDGIDILITHTPPAGICDASTHWQEGGCSALMTELSRVRPRLHVCGHCHEGRGAALVRWSGGVELWEDPGRNNKKMSKFNLSGPEADRETGVVNESIMASSHGRGPKSINKPIVVDLAFQKGGGNAVVDAP